MKTVNAVSAGMDWVKKLTDGVSGPNGLIASFQRLHR